MNNDDFRILEAWREFKAARRSLLHPSNDRWYAFIVAMNAEGRHHAGWSTAVFRAESADTVGNLIDHLRRIGNYTDFVVITRDGHG